MTTCIHTVIVALTMMILAATPSSAQTTPLLPDPSDPPVLAHYYIWFSPSSWNRAKIDYPIAGRYSSDQESVMRRHVRDAKSAGIDGFIVSWKSTEVLDPRLEQLIRIAEEEDFKLAITFQSLDFNRDPLPVARVEQDLDLFIEKYADSPVFDIFGKPLVVWTGTWEYSYDDIEFVTASRRKDLLLLGTEKNVKGYERIADIVDGDLYYWASVNPETYPGYPAKLASMGEAVRSHGGIWIAPVAPGYNSLALGGTTTVDRADGRTLATEWDAAVSSSPHAIGLISWNEFSENTYIEPSRNYGNKYLRAIASITDSPVPAVIDFDSSAPSGSATSGEGLSRLGALLGLSVLVFGGLVVVFARTRRTGASSL